MPCSSNQYPPSPYDRRNPDYESVKSELALRLAEIKYLSTLVVKQGKRIEKLEEDYNKLLDYYQLMGNGS